MSKFGNILVWISRCTHCRGFGVQSPFAYHFIRYVVNEHDPYYAYSDLDVSLPDIQYNDMKLGRLLFRIANYCQADNWIDYPAADHHYREFVSAACKKTRFVPIASDADLEQIKAIDVVTISIKDDYSEFFESVIDQMTDKSVMIIVGIHHDKKSKSFWKKVIADHRTGVSFDLYYCGVIFFDHKMYKRNYIVNF
jgi:hypothetical protein